MLCYVMLCYVMLCYVMLCVPDWVLFAMFKPFMQSKAWVKLHNIVVQHYCFLPRPLYSCLTRLKLTMYCTNNDLELLLLSSDVRSNNALDLAAYKNCSLPVEQVVS